MVVPIIDLEHFEPNSEALKNPVDDDWCFETSGCVEFIFSRPNYYLQRFYSKILSAEQSDSIKLIDSTVNKLSNIVTVIW